MKTKPTTTRKEPFEDPTKEYLARHDDMTKESKPKAIQIAAISDRGEPYAWLFALDSNGKIWQIFFDKDPRNWDAGEWYPLPELPDTGQKD